MTMSFIESAPNISLDEAVALADRWYKLQTTASILPSERDQNFKLTTPDNNHYILKISNVHESKEFLEAQNETMDWVIDRYWGKVAQPKDCHIIPELTASTARTQRPICQVPVSNFHGSKISTIELGGKCHFLRLLTWLDGEPLGTMKEKPVGLLFELGRVMGKIDLTLLHYDHPAIHRDFHWDVSNAMREISKFKHEIQDQGKKNLIERVLARLELDWAAKTAKLRRNVIHSDVNDYNVLVDTESLTALDCPGVAITGILDWGDMVYSYLVCEPAIAAAYGLLDRADPLEAISQVVSGFHAVYPLLEVELAVVFNLVCARLCMSVCLSAHPTGARNPILLAKKSKILVYRTDMKIRVDRY